jgi:5'-nucleotidase/UDP-sugar diphosphatase
MRNMKKRQWLGLILWVMFTLSFLVQGCGTNPVPTPAAFTPPTIAAPYQLTVLHTSENHGHWEATEVSKVSQGGIARRATMVKKIRAEAPHSLLLDSGDISQGTLYFTQYRGSEGRELYNLLGYDAVVTGNHDYDAGPKLMAENFLRGAQFSVVASNMDFSGEPLLAGRIPATVIKTVGGEKVGIFGLVTSEVVTTSSPGPNVTMKDTIQSAKEAVAELNLQGVNKIILLSHLGFPADQALAAQVNDIDVIVSGHTDTLMGDPTKLDSSLGTPVSSYPAEAHSPDGGTTLIAHAFSWGRLLGRLDVTFNNRGEIITWEGQPIFIDKNIQDDPVVAEKLSDLAKPLEDLKKQIIGKTTVNLDGQRAVVRNQESNLGNLVADATLWSTSKDQTQIALVNGGGIRASIPEGDISISRVLEALPFGNRLIHFDLSGIDVLAVLENGISTVEADPEKSGGRFLQVAGLKFSADLSKPVGSRVTEVFIGSTSFGYEPLDKAATYRVVSLDFMLNGGDGYTMFKKAQNIRGGDVPEEEAVMEYLKANSPVSPKVEGRITLVK